MSDTPTSTPETPKSVKLSQQGLEHLQLLLNSTAWAKSLTLVSRGSDALEKLPELDLPPLLRGNYTADELRAHKAATDAWKAKEVEFSLSTREHKAVVACLEHYKDLAAVPVSKHAVRLFKTFGLKTDDDS